MVNSTAEDSHLAAVGTHKPGSIQKIVLKRFLTYNHVVISPGPRLNVVIGPNGTGKSSILNAICLGLGGDPKLLGRADDARDYVMHGEETASIEITLTPKPGATTHVIERVIDRNRGSEKGLGRGASTFTINGEKVNVKEVRDLVSSEYKITIDNLCSFLPQDKVSSFSSMSEQDRLLETEKTLAGDYYNMHQQLIQAEDDLSDNAGDLESLREKLRKYKHENEQLERAAALVAERQKALEEADLISKKLLWVEFDILRNKALELKAAKAVIKKKIEEISKEMRPLQEKEDKLLELKQKSEAIFKAHEEHAVRCKKDMEKQSRKYDNHDDSIEEILSQLNELDSKRSKLEADVKIKKAKHDELELKISEIPSLSDVEAEVQQTKGQRKQIQKEHDQAKRHEQDLDHRMRDLQEQTQRVQQHIAKLDNVAENRKKQVYRKFPALLNVSTLIEKEKGRFRRQVWGPVACEIAAKSKEIASMLEQHIPNNCLKSFVVEEKRDYDQLYSWIRGEKNIPINVNLISGGELRPLARIYSEQKMTILKQQHGILGYMDECFNAPDAIMQNLRNAAMVHKVLIGTDETLDSIDQNGLLDYLAKPEVGQDPNKAVSFCVFATRGKMITKFTGKVSRYTGKITISQEHVREASFLMPGVNEHEKQKAMERLADAHKQVDELRPDILSAQENRRKLETLAQEAHGAYDAAMQTREQVLKFQSKLKQAKRNLKEALESLNSSDADEKKSLASALMSRVSNSISALLAQSEQQEMITKSIIASAAASANKRSLNAAVAEARNVLNEKKALHTDVEQEARRIQADFSKAKKDAGDKKAMAEDRAPLVDEEGRETELKHQIEAIALVTVTELQVAYEESMAKANDITDDPNATRLYEQRKRDIQQLEEELEHRENQEATKAERVKELAQQWEEGLENHIASVNKLFKKYMSEMACVGEVVLSKGKNEVSSYKDWGIQILVSFRGEAKVQPLSAERNSGGERSVCTIMYLMALQEMMVAPFRCVDEINQGLDERNERLVFRRIVANSCRPPVRNTADHSGQYFLITPKLLPNLTDMEEEAVSVLIVLNGLHCFPHPEDWQHFLSKKLCRSHAQQDCDAEENNSNNTAACRVAKKSRYA